MLRPFWLFGNNAAAAGGLPLYCTALLPCTLLDSRTSSWCLSFVLIYIAGGCRGSLSLLPAGRLCSPLLGGQAVWCQAPGLAGRMHASMHA